MILAELNVRHTRRHMPTRRVALDHGYLPMHGSAYGAALLAAVVAENAGALDEEQADVLPRFLRAAADGLSVPRIALRYRLQTDVHGLDRSRHRLVEEHGLFVVELDVHGAPVPQLIGAVMAAAAMGPTSRRAALRAIRAAVDHPGVVPEPFVVRRLFHGIPGARPAPAAPGAGSRLGPGANRLDEDAWRGMPVEQRWAMEVLGLVAGARLDRGDVQRRFRRLVRLAHPDHGGESLGAAERIAELTEAREVLLERLASQSQGA